MAEGKDDGSSSSRNPVDVYLQRANKRRLDIATQGIEFDPQDSDPLSSRMSHRFMFAEFLGSLFYGLISQGCVITSGVLTFQFTYKNLTPGRLVSIAISNAFIQTATMFSVLPYASNAGSKEEEHSSEGPDLNNLKINRDQYVVGHFNPVITMAMWLMREIQFAQACMFWVAQFFGFSLASLLLVNSVPDAENSHLGAPEICEKCRWHHGILMEMILSFFMVWACFIFMVRPPKGFVREFRATLYGFFLLVANFIGAGISGACMNPARALGPSLVANAPEIWKNHWIYWVGPICGALLAVGTMWLETKPSQQLLPNGDIKLVRFPVRYEHPEGFEDLYAKDDHAKKDN